MSGNNRFASSEDAALFPEPPDFVVIGEHVIDMASSDEEENALTDNNGNVPHVPFVVIIIYFFIDGVFIPVIAFVLYHR